MSDSKDISLEEMSFKKATISAQKIDGMKGEVEAIVAGIGNKDRVGDIIVPGAFTASLKRRTPKVVWGHDWNKPIGKVLDIKEIPPTDRRLPKKLRDVNGSGLWAKIAFNMATQRGKDALADVLFYGQDQEWSIGYKTLKGRKDPINKANLLEELDLFELSPVLYGANNLTATVPGSTKDEKEHGMVRTEVLNFGDPGVRSPRLAQAVARALQMPVNIKRVTLPRRTGDGSVGCVYFETEPGSMWKADFYGDEQNGYSIQSPEKLLGSALALLTPEDVPSIMQVKFGEEDDGVGFDSSEEAEKLSGLIGCETGSHKTLEGFLPCASDTEYKQAVDKFHEGGSTVAVKSGCSCSSEKSYSSPVSVLESVALGFADDPYLKSKFDGVLEALSSKNDSSYMTDFSVQLDCTVDDGLGLSEALAGMPVFVSKTDTGVSIDFSSKMLHDDVLDVVSEALGPMQDRISELSVKDNRFSRIQKGI